MRYLVLFLALLAFPAFAEPTNSTGTITITIKEYDELKEAVEGDEKDQWWKMTFQQILEKQRGNEAKAWELYEFYVLRTLYLDSQVTSSSVDSVIEDFNVLAEIDAEKPIRLVISSPGGSVFDGFRLYNAMMASEPPIHTVCDGMAASMAAVILSAGDHRVARDGCIFMVHEVGGGGGGGQTTDMVKVADWYISVDDVLVGILSENSGLSVPDILELYRHETFWNAEETLALGFVDEVESGKPRELVAGTRSIPDELRPTKRIVRHVTQRVGE